MSMTEIVTDVSADDAGISVHLTNGESFAWNDTISGIVTLSPHPAETVTFSEITVGIAEQDTEGFMTPVGFAGSRDPLNPVNTAFLGAEYAPLGNAPLERSYGETVVARDMTLTPGSDAREVPFTISVSPDIRLTTLCFVAARAVATDGVDSDRHAAAAFVLLPPPFIQAIQNALKTFGDFEEVEMSNRNGADGSTHYTLDYVAPETLQDRLDGIKFELVEGDATVTGFAEINPQEKTFADHLRSFVHADRVRLPLAFDRAEMDAAGAAKSPAASVKQRLHELLDTFLNPVAS